MNTNKGADPRLLLAVQMLLIGLVLVILGTVVLILSPISQMPPFIRKMALLSDLSIILVGTAFTVGGLIKLKRVKPEMNQIKDK
jgi:hypothetical protein